MADKQTVLVEAISAGTHAKMAPELKKLMESAAQSSVTLNAILARLDLVESVISSGATTAKRTVRTAGAAAAKKSGAKAGTKKPAGSDASKVTNTLLYFRYAMANDLEDVRTTYATEENIDSIRHEETLIKKEKDKEKDESGYYSTVGFLLWKTFTEEQKDEIRSQYNAWKEQAARDNAEPPLEEEEVAE